MKLFLVLMLAGVSLSAPSSAIAYNFGAHVLMSGTTHSYTWTGHAPRSSPECWNNAVKQGESKINKYANISSFIDSSRNVQNRGITQNVQVIGKVVTGSQSWTDTKDRARSYAASQRGYVVAIKPQRGWLPGTHYRSSTSRWGVRDSRCGGTVAFDWIVYGPKAEAPKPNPPRPTPKPVPTLERKEYYYIQKKDGTVKK